MPSKPLNIAQNWFRSRGWSMFPFQRECFQAVIGGASGLLNAPTGSGKTYALGLPLLINSLGKKQPKGLKVLWITPLRALSVDIAQALQEASDELNVGWRIERRSGDVSTAVKQAQWRNSPDCLVSTPESLMLMLARKGYDHYLRNLDAVVVDEWHELLGNKRGVQVELALSRLRTFLPALKVWGISATVGNMQEAVSVLHGSAANQAVIVRANIRKKLQIKTLLPYTMEELPWAGHLGMRLLKKVLPIIEKNESTLIFTNTRSQAEIWYQKLIEKFPSLAGRIALHHGSLDKEVRSWVEGALHSGALKAVVSTSSLDLGVDFRPVSAVIQIGSPKGIARFVQRAGRSGHSPKAVSTVYFLPTNALEVVESSAIQSAIKQGFVEQRVPVVRAFDVLVQYLVTLAVSDGFVPEVVFEEVRKTHCFSSITREEFDWVMHFVTQGGESLQAYEDFNKVVFDDGRYVVKDRKIARRHYLSMGTIVSDTAMVVKKGNGKKIGTIEEYFISRLNIGDQFIFAGQTLELTKVQGLSAYVQLGKRKKAAIPSWNGSRMSLSSEIAHVLRMEVDRMRGGAYNPESKKLQSLLALQKEMSHLPAANELLIEYYASDDGHHVYVYPFEGRMVHEGMAMLLAYRMSKITSISLSLGMNDYGFELLSEVEIPLMDALEEDWFRTDDLLSDIEQSSNMTALAGKKFREIAAIAGLTFRGYPHREAKERHLQTHAQLFFDVFSEYEPSNLLLQQAYEEVLYNQLETTRIRKALERIGEQEIVIRKLNQPSPLSFPLLVDGMSRDSLSNESLDDVVKRLLAKPVDNT